ncbi:hypothetical protein E7T09_04230 [Deinococcus sp. KSM4-11]|uniref:hypothetical protein n=1 Tax=Deinococcus sp. KSM4-11 TaxID=2568654 RepID=UPI0010A319EA|nr:hypothetical protein [Deinococcus sp. KSM4-11]THF88421.1 hypothetical protein E7T09_04230 [Deinococcus sp. KSM4-11]
MFSSDRRLNRSVSLAEALGGRDGQPLELNSPESATCRRCGAEPRMHHTVTASGRDVVAWIPTDHWCPKKS